MAVTKRAAIRASRLPRGAPARAPARSGGAGGAGGAPGTGKAPNFDDMDDDIPF
ncbi:MAG: hypothetical protein M5U30_13780 [Burkholderiaceae bacterium]|nr:hypothetical protein [Burkholderiaceae bacterium]